MGMQDPQPSWGNQLAHECKATSAFCVAHIELPCSSCQGLNTSFPFNRHFQPCIRFWVCWECFVCRELSFPSRHQIALCCWLPHLSSTRVEKPPLATPSSALCHSLIFCLIWYCCGSVSPGCFCSEARTHVLPELQCFCSWVGAGFIWEGRGRDGTGFLFPYTTPEPQAPTLPCTAAALQTQKFHFFPLVLYGFT